MEGFTQMPVATFLFLYTVYSAFLLVIFRILYNRDASRKLAVPEPTKLHPYELAFLQKGYKGLLFSGLYSLWRDNKLELQRDKRPTEIKKKARAKGNNEYENYLLQLIAQPVTFRKAFRKTSRTSMHNQAKAHIGQLKQLLLLPDDAIIRKRKHLRFNGLLFLFIPAGSKLALNLAHNHLTLGIIVAMILFTGLFLLLVKPNQRPTFLGRRFLKQARRRFAGARRSDRSKIRRPSMDVMYAAALFGFGGLTGDRFAEDLTRAMKQTPNMHKDDEDFEVEGGCDDGGCGDGGCSGCGGCGGCG